MNEALNKFAKDYLKEGLSKLPESSQLVFKRMYSNNNLKADINDVVDNMSEEKLDWAMEQVRRSLSKLL